MKGFQSGFWPCELLVDMSERWDTFYLFYAFQRNTVWVTDWRERARGGKAGRRSKINIEDISLFEAALLFAKFHWISPHNCTPPFCTTVRPRSLEDSLRDSGTTATSSHRPRLPPLTTPILKTRLIDRLLMENKLLWISLSGEITQHRELSHNYVQWVSRKWTPWDFMCESVPAPITFQESAKQHQ